MIPFLLLPAAVSASSFSTTRRRPRWKNPTPWCYKGLVLMMTAVFSSLKEMTGQKGRCAMGGRRGQAPAAHLFFNCRLRHLQRKAAGRAAADRR